MGWLRIDVQIENAAGFSQLKTHCEFLIKCFVSKRGWVGQCSSGSVRSVGLCISVQVIVWVCVCQCSFLRASMQVWGCECVCERERERERERVSERE